MDLALNNQRRLICRFKEKPNQTKLNVNDIALLANTLAQAKSLLHSLERAAGWIVLNGNADITEYMYFNQ